jgi:hypothetical protein
LENQAEFFCRKKKDQAAKLENLVVKKNNEISKNQKFYTQLTVENRSFNGFFTNFKKDSHDETL